MGVINMIKTIKQIHKEDIVFIRVGTFYQVYGKDAYIISYLFDYRIKFIETVPSCGFPKSSINKIMAKLEELKINYLILDKKNSYDTELFFNNGNLNNYDKHYKKAKIIINLKIRVESIYESLLKEINDGNKNINDKIKEIETIVNER